MDLDMDEPLPIIRRHALAMNDQSSKTEVNLNFNIFSSNDLKIYFQHSDQIEKESVGVEHQTLSSEPLHDGSYDTYGSLQEQLQFDLLDQFEEFNTQRRDYDEFDDSSVTQDEEMNSSKVYEPKNLEELESQSSGYNSVLENETQKEKLLQDDKVTLTGHSYSITSPRACDLKTLKQIPSPSGDSNFFPEYEIKKKKFSIGEKIDKNSVYESEQTFSQSSDTKSVQKDVFYFQDNEQETIQNFSRQKHNCEVCSKSYSKKSDLSNHIKRHHATENQKSFVTNADLLNHSNLQVQEKQFHCVACEKSFLTKNELLKHSVIHQEKTKQYTCSICNKKFIKNIHYINHLSIHNEEKKYTCSVCKEVFRKEVSYKKHMNDHNDKRPFSCKLCQKSFKRPANLKEHMLTHSDIMPYSCEICQRPFRIKRYVTKHMKTHTK